MVADPEAKEADESQKPYEPEVVCLLHISPFVERHSHRLFNPRAEGARVEKYGAEICSMLSCLTLLGLEDKEIWNGWIAFLIPECIVLLGIDPDCVGLVGFQFHRKDASPSILKILNSFLVGNFWERILGLHAP